MTSFSSSYSCIIMMIKLYWLVSDVLGWRAFTHNSYRFVGAASIVFRVGVHVTIPWGILVYCTPRGKPPPLLAIDILALSPLHGNSSHLGRYHGSLLWNSTFLEVTEIIEIEQKPSPMQTAIETGVSSLHFYGDLEDTASISRKFQHYLIHMHRPVTLYYFPVY